MSRTLSMTYSPCVTVSSSDCFEVAGPGLSNFTFPDDQALFVVGDVHGQAAYLDGLLDEMSRQDTGSLDRKLVFLGDLVDRGPDSLKSVQLAGTSGDRFETSDVTWLPGNHELMMFGAADGNAEDAACWLTNGGRSVCDEVVNTLGLDPDSTPGDCARAFLSAMPEAWSLTARQGPGCHRPDDADVLCVHAGVLPKPAMTGQLQTPGSDHLGREHAHHWAWVRQPFLHWQGGFFDAGARAMGRGAGRTEKGRLVFHGHTPALENRKSNQEDPEVVRKVFDRTRTNARVCLDGGAALGLGVAGALLTSRGLRLFYAH